MVFFVIFVTVVIEQACDEDDSIDCIENVLIIYWTICIGCDLLYVLYALGDISEWEIWVHYFNDYYSC